jgi:hypothetical protein
MGAFSILCKKKTVFITVSKLCCLSAAPLQGSLLFRAFTSDLGVLGTGRVGGGELLHVLGVVWCGRDGDCIEGK